MTIPPAFAMPTQPAPAAPFAQAALATGRGHAHLSTMRARLARLLRVVAIGAGLLPAAAMACSGSVVRIIVPVVPGGPMDSLARNLAHALEQDSGKPHVVENRSGGMTIPAWDAVAKAAPDGCTLLVASTSGRTVLPWQVARLPLDPARDLVPVTPLADVPQVFVAHPATGIRSLADLVQRARREPGGVSIAIPTPGALTHLAALALQREAGIRLNEVPYRGGVPAALAVRSGEVALMSADVGAVLPLVRAGELVAVATAGARRLPQLPDVPTVAEAGFGDLQAVNVYALFAPVRLPTAQLLSLQQRVATALQLPALALPLRHIGMVPRTATPAGFEAELRAEEARLAPLARAAANLAP
ncbi:MAG: Bug family tripartite tricarboxylate transporter substrate binding protein [Aquabacterium sp.]